MTQRINMTEKLWDVKPQANKKKTPIQTFGSCLVQIWVFFRRAEKFD